MCFECFQMEEVKLQSVESSSIGVLQQRLSELRRECAALHEKLRESSCANDELRCQQVKEYADRQTKEADLVKERDYLLLRMQEAHNELHEKFKNATGRAEKATSELERSRVAEKEAKKGRDQAQSRLSECSAERDELWRSLKKGTKVKQI